MQPKCTRTESRFHLAAGVASPSRESGSLLTEAGEPRLVMPARGLGMAQFLGVLAVVYVVLMFGISAWSQRRVHDVEDFVVAGRRLPLYMAAPTLLATWYGAGTLLTAADEVGRRGLSAALLDPVGAGVCLLVAGFAFAKPLWRLKLKTLPDLFRLRFGPRAELLSSLLMVPTYFGWIAAQFMALGALLELSFGWPLDLAVVVVALVGTGYTWVGGMWAVTVTDLVQVGLVTVGLVVLSVMVIFHLGDGDLAMGWVGFFDEVPAHRLSWIGEDGAAAALGVLAAGALGNLPSQDLLQRIFASRDEHTARAACVGAGGLYLVLGAAPVFLGLVGPRLGVGVDGRALLPALAEVFLHPALAAIFLLTVMSAVLSTIDSAILGPATVLSENVVEPAGVLRSRPLLRNRLMVLLVAAISLAVAFAGESAYSLLESAYELGLVSLLVPMTMAIYARQPHPGAAMASMLSGTVLWTLHFLAGATGFLGTSVPVGLACFAVSAGAYALASRGRTSG